MRTQKHADRIATMSAPAAYLRRALVHEHVSGLRRLRRRVPTSALEGNDPGGMDEAASVDARDATWRLLATLPRQQRAVLVLRFYEDLPDSEIAEMLGCREPTVRSNASRALATLRARLAENEEARA
jgi:RNA polymerase sigma factor (sigma-70 family)